MPDGLTVGALFDAAIAAERAAEHLYRELAARFVHHPAVSEFWQGYADDEDGHASRVATPAALDESGF